MSVWVERIGDATLYLGDAREVCAALPNDVADMIFTDPPYGHNNNNNGDLIQRREAALGHLPIAGSDPRPIANDGAEQAHELADWLFRESPRLLAKGGCCCCCGGGGGPDPQFARWALLMDGSLDFKQMVVWDKGPMGMGWHYRRSYETVLVGQKKGGACKWHDETNRIENIIRQDHLGIRKLIPAKTDHPTPKPPELARHFIRLHTLPGETVLDPFMGGGSTAEAAVKEGRRFIGVEIDPHWFYFTCARLRDVEKQPDMFIESPKPQQQAALDLTADPVPERAPNAQSDPQAQSAGTEDSPADRRQRIPPDPFDDGWEHAAANSMGCWEDAITAIRERGEGR